MNALTPPSTAVPNASYDETRFNALRHGVLSRHAILPGEDRAEYQAPCWMRSRQSTRHKVRPRSISSRNWRASSGVSAVSNWPRLRSTGSGLRKEAASTFEPEQIGGAAPPSRGRHAQRQGQPTARTIKTPADTARDLRDVKRGPGYTTSKALNILVAGGPDSYARALTALREDTRASWLECLA